MNAVQGLEMFYKIFYKDEKISPTLANIKEDKLKKKVSIFLEELNEISDDLIPNRKYFIDKVVATRNHFAHYNLFSREGDLNIISNNVLGAYSRRLEIFNDFILLFSLGVPKDVLIEKFRHHINYLIYRDQNYIFK